MKQTPKDEWHDPQEPRNLSGVQFRYIHPGAPKQHPMLHGLRAYNSEGRNLGEISWHKKTGKINNIHVTEIMRGLGLGTNMINRGRQIAADTGIKAPEHSRHRTDAGDAWARAVGGTLPPRAKEPDEEE